MAKELGLKTKSAYSKKETGRTPITINEAVIIARVLGTSVSAIFFEQ